MTMRVWTEIAEGVHVTTSALYATTSTVIRSDHRVLLVDPAWTSSELAGIADDLDAWGVTVAAGFATHPHHDHLLWHPQFGKAPRLTSERSAAAAIANRDLLVASLGEGWPADLVDLMGRVEPTSALNGSTELVTHDAHAPGHTAVWLPQVRVLLAGDMLSDLELPLPEQTGLAAYANGLDVLRPYVERAAVLVPGHGSPTTEPMKRWLADRRYLDGIRAGGDPDDSRRHLPDMEEAHAANRALAERS